MVIMQHIFKVKHHDGSMEKIISSLLDFGDDKYTSIAKTVAYPAAIGVKMILEGKIAIKWVHITILKEIYEPILRELKELGCKFSLDDFGSGLSSFTYLKNLPVDYLKIDGQFISNVADDNVDESMVKAIHEVGSAMGIETIAERVETREVLEKLGALGVEFAQGYYIARPTPIEAGLFSEPVRIELPVQDSNEPIQLGAWSGKR